MTVVEMSVSTVLLPSRWRRSESTSQVSMKETVTALSCGNRDAEMQEYLWKHAPAFYVWKYIGRYEIWHLSSRALRFNQR